MSVSYIDRDSDDWSQFSCQSLDLAGFRTLAWNFVSDVQHIHRVFKDVILFADECCPRCNKEGWCFSSHICTWMGLWDPTTTWLSNCSKSVMVVTDVSGIWIHIWSYYANVWYFLLTMVEEWMIRLLVSWHYEGGKFTCSTIFFRLN